MSPQEALEIGAKGVIAQGKPSMLNEMCLYRGVSGAKCFIGHLIPDEEYTSDMDSNKCITMADIIKKVSTLKNLDEVFLIACQRAHDHAGKNNFIYNFKERIRKIAKDYHLDSSFMDEIKSETA